MSDGRKTVLLIAGEASGDTLGAELIKAMRAEPGGDLQRAVCLDHGLLSDGKLFCRSSDNRTAADQLFQSRLSDVWCWKAVSPPRRCD